MNLRITIGILLLALLAMAPFSSRAFEPEKPVSQVPEASALIEEVWNGLGGNLGVPELDDSIAKLEKAERLDPSNHDLLIILCDLYWERGERVKDASEQGKKEAECFFLKCHETAKRALEIEDSAAAHYYAAIGLGAVAENQSILKQVSSFPEVRSHMEWIGENDRHYGDGAYARFWCDCYVNAPKPIIKVIGHGQDEVCDMLDEAIEHNPEDVSNYMYRIRCCHDETMKEKSVSLLEKALKADEKSAPKQRQYNAYFREKALKYWKELTGKEYPAR